MTKRPLRILYGAIVGIIVGISLARALVPPADLIVFNGPIHTMNENQPSVEMVAVKGDRIVYAGKASVYDQWAGPS